MMDFVCMKSAETALQCVSTFSSGLSSVAINLPAGVGKQDAELKKTQTGASNNPSVHHIHECFLCSALSSDYCINAAERC